jgi:hypothetical protein
MHCIEGPYAAEFRRQMVERVLAGRTPSQPALEFARTALARENALQRFTRGPRSR